MLMAAQVVIPRKKVGLRRAAGSVYSPPKHGSTTSGTIARKLERIFHYQAQRARGVVAGIEILALTNMAGAPSAVEKILCDCAPDPPTNLVSVHLVSVCIVRSVLSDASNAVDVD